MLILRIPFNVIFCLYYYVNILFISVSDHDSNTGDWQEAMTPAPGLGGPQLTSTVMKRRRVDEESLGGASEPGSEQDFEGS